jgi:hypothetical protein
MLRDLSLSVSPILALLLIVLSPMSSGQGAHRGQMFDPLFPHVHFGTGMLTSAQTAAAQKAARRIVSGDPQAPALGAGAGAAPVAVSLGLTPPVPGWLALVPFGAFAWDVAPASVRPLEVLAEPPPDPPPTAA